jgi:hypothetical protein
MRPAWAKTYQDSGQQISQACWWIPAGNSSNIGDLGRMIRVPGLYRQKVIPYLKMVGVVVQVAEGPEQNPSTRKQCKYLGVNLTKKVNDLYMKTKMLKKQVEGEIRRWKVHLCSWISKNIL